MDIPIINFELARNYFFAMGCSHFHMAREYPDRYTEYCSLSISKNIEYQWETEYFQELFDKLMQEGNSDIVWRLHSSMEKIVHSINTDDAYHKMLIATRQASKVAQDGHRIIIAETINGRLDHSCRSGLIYRSFDRGQHDHAKEFAFLSVSLAERDNNPSTLALPDRPRSRMRQAIDNCKSIKRELGL